jgi:hypothetical protein
MRLSQCDGLIQGFDSRSGIDFGTNHPANNAPRIKIFYGAYPSELAMPVETPEVNRRLLRFLSFQ